MQLLVRCTKIVVPHAQQRVSSQMLQSVLNNVSTVAFVRQVVYGTMMDDVWIQLNVINIFIYNLR